MTLREHAEAWVEEHADELMEIATDSRLFRAAFESGWKARQGVDAGIADKIKQDHCTAASSDKVNDKLIGHAFRALGAAEVDQAIRNTD